MLFGSYLTENWFLIDVVSHHNVEKFPTNVKVGRHGLVGVQHVTGIVSRHACKKTREI